MKINTTELLKFKRLCRELGESKRGVAGLLELLWLETARQSPDGAIGRFSNVDIAILCDFEGDPDAMVQSLVSTGWLDECEGENRLVVHDWPQHCPKWVKGSLASKGKTFAGVVNGGDTSELARDEQEESPGNPQDIERTPLKPGSSSGVRDGGTPPPLSPPLKAPASKTPATNSIQFNSIQAKSETSPARSGVRPLTDCAVFCFRVRGGGDFRLMPGKIEEYQATWPDMDVEAELRSLGQWTRDNPDRCRSREDIGAWITNRLGSSHAAGRYHQRDPAPAAAVRDPALAYEMIRTQVYREMQANGEELEEEVIAARVNQLILKGAS